MSCLFGFSASPTVVNPSYKQTIPKISELLSVKVQMAFQDSSNCMIMTHYLNYASIPLCYKEKILYILSAPFRHEMQINFYNFPNTVSIYETRFYPRIFNKMCNHNHIVTSTQPSRI